VHLDRPSYGFTDSAGVTVGTPPVSFTPHTVWASEDVLDDVLASAGSRPAGRDAVDARIADPVTGEVAQATGGIVDHSEGLWPSYSSASEPFDEGTDPNGDDDGDGHSNIEERLFRYASCVQTGTGCP